jgi:hypothetical protein
LRVNRKVLCWNVAQPKRTAFARVCFPRRAVYTDASDRSSPYNSVSDRRQRRPGLVKRHEIPELMSAASASPLRPILVTGGAGFIGSNFVRAWLAQETSPAVNLDKLTYAGNLDNLSGLPRTRLEFVHGDIGDVQLVKSLLVPVHPRAIINFAAETHVDRSIHGPDDFITTNVVGTFRLLECARDYWQLLDAAEQSAFRVLHVSTDEVYGTLSAEDAAFSEANSRPRQPSTAFQRRKRDRNHVDHVIFPVVTSCMAPTITSCLAVTRLAIIRERFGRSCTVSRTLASATFCTSGAL